MSILVTDSALSSRTMSSWPVSIGTAIAFETLRVGPNPVYDPERKMPKGGDISKYDSFWINLKTLYRNMLGAVPGQSQEGVMAAECLYALEYEVETIREIITTISKGEITPTFYSTNYEDIEKIHPNAIFRKYTTPKQLVYQAQETTVISEFHKRHDEKEGVYLIKRNIVPLTPTRGIILTHSAYDLLSLKYFTDLHLLESHTGVIKERSQFYTKFSSSGELVGIPMNSTMLQVFGDSITFQPFKINERRDVLEVAAERNWSSITTKDRIRLSLDLMKNKELSSKLLSMLKEDI